MNDPYSRVGGCRRRDPRERPLRIEGKTYCMECGRDVRPKMRRKLNFGQEKFVTIWLHVGPIFSISNGCA